jgi:thymidylate kinase
MRKTRSEAGGLAVQVPDRPFVVLLGPDYAGKSAAMAELARSPSPWRCVSVDDSFIGPGHELIGRLKRHLVTDTLPALGTSFSFDFAMSMLQTAVVHLRDQVADRRQPALVDSYYYKILAKCRLIGGADTPLFSWWRSFPQPSRVLYLDVSPETAWLRTRAGATTNRLEHYGEQADQATFTTFQADLRTTMLGEVEGLPVTVLRERSDVASTVRDIREVLADECA